MTFYSKQSWQIWRTAGSWKTWLPYTRIAQYICLVDAPWENIVKKMRKLFTEFPLHILGLYGSTPYLQKYETVVQVSVKLGIILTCKTECKGLFRSRKACKHHRATQRELAKVKPRFFHLIYHPFVSIAHSCEINLRQLVATFNRLPVWKYVKRSWALHILFFSYCPCLY